jgi:hypothetical protein
MEYKILTLEARADVLNCVNPIYGSPEPYRCARLKLANKYYETDLNPTRPYIK